MIVAFHNPLSVNIQRVGEARVANFIEAKLSGTVGQVLLSTVSLLAISACSHRSDDRAKSNSAVPLRGDHVLVESSAARFYEARVISEEASRLRVQAVPSGDTAFVQIADTYRLPAKFAKLLPHAFAICNVDREHWVGCKIAAATEAGATVNDINQNSYQLPASQIVSPNALTELNLKRLFDKAAEQREFEHDMTKAGSPRLVPGWQPVPGKSAIAKVDSKWWLSVIVAEKHGKLRIKFAGTDHVLDVLHSEVAPEPPYPMEVSQKSRIALIRPASAAQAWLPIRLISVDALEAVVEDLARGRRTVPVRDVCPLESPSQ